MELAGRETKSSWREFLVKLKQRGLRGVIFVVSDHHEGLRQTIGELLPGAIWQRGYVHFLRNAQDHFPRKGDEDCLTEPRWMYERRDVAEARRDLTVWLEKCIDRYPKLCDRVKENIEETFSFYYLPRAHHKHMKSTNMVKRLNEEVRRRAGAWVPSHRCTQACSVCLRPILQNLTHITRILPSPNTTARCILRTAVDRRGCSAIRKG